MEKLKTRSEFDEMKARGLKWNDPLFTFLALPLPDGETGLRCGIICSRRFHKRAVVRNRARRILWEALRLSQGKIPSCRILMIPRQKIRLVKMTEVKEHLEKIIPTLGQRLRPSDTCGMDMSSPCRESC